MFFEERNTTQGEHENIIAATIIKVVAEIFKINLPISLVSKVGECCDLSIKSLLKKVNFIELQK